MGKAHSSPGALFGIKFLFPTDSAGKCICELQHFKWLKYKPIQEYFVLVLRQEKMMEMQSDDKWEGCLS